MKYICFDLIEYHLFSPWLSHKDEAMLRPNKEPTSAGFVRNTADGLECYGDSSTLGLRPAPNDTQRLNAMMREVVQ